MGLKDLINTRKAEDQKNKTKMELLKKWEDVKREYGLDFSTDSFDAVRYSLETTITNGVDIIPYVNMLRKEQHLIRQCRKVGGFFWDDLIDN